MKQCTVPHCGRVEYLAHGYCDKHYKRWRKTGDPLRTSLPSQEDRFWAQVDKTDECWLWTGCPSNVGYGFFRIGGRRGRTWLAHRVSYEMSVGPIPEGLVLDHLCSVRLCVNPAHLEPVTPQENVRRAYARVTHCPQGHPYDEANTRINRGRRICRACHRLAERGRQARLRAAKAVA